MNNINSILEKYWKAEANLQEEAELRQYFSSQDVAEEHVAYKGLFAHMSAKRSTNTELNISELISNLDNIDDLLSKYWNAETSLNEEKILKAYFSGNDVTSEHKEYVPLFSFYDNASQLSTEVELSVPNELIDENIDSLLAKYWNAETTIAEESILKSYFANEVIAEEHKEYRDLFTHMDVVSEMTTDIDLSQAFITESIDISTLVEKYFNAESTLEEEAMLTDYFASTDIAPEHESLRDLFQFYANQKSANTNINLKYVLDSQSETVGNAASDNTPAPKQGQAKIFSIRKMASAIAAIFVLGFAVVSVMNQASPEETKYKGKYVMLDEEAEAQEAYEITKQAFALLSK